MLWTTCWSKRYIVFLEPISFVTSLLIHSDYFSDESPRSLVFCESVFVSERHSTGSMAYVTAQTRFRRTWSVAWHSIANASLYVPELLLMKSAVARTRFYNVLKGRCRDLRVTEPVRFLRISSSGNLVVNRCRSGNVSSLQTTPRFLEEPVVRYN